LFLHEQFKGIIIIASSPPPPRAEGRGCLRSARARAARSRASRRSARHPARNSLKLNEDVNFDLPCSKNKAVEPYWRFAWRAEDWAQWKCGKDTGYMEKHMMCNLLERPDLILQIGHLCPDSGQITKRVVLCEIDGEKKTENARNQDEETKKRRKDDPIKLALKLMSSSGAQLVLQEDTYHIRSNYCWYDV
jgi:hypothetical protein